MSEQSRRDLAQLLVPCVVWENGEGYANARPAIEAALAMGVGGFQFVGGEQDAVRALAKELQQKSRHPLLIAAELERGAGQQFTGATGLPPLAAIAAAGDMESLRRAARLTAREARTMGVNWNLAPVCDLDELTTMPLTGNRAMGSDPRRVAPMVAAWIEACQAEGVLACAKHFPGLGRASRNVNAATPVIDAPADVLKDADLAPFRAAIAGGVASIMTAHASYPSLDASRSSATLSREMLQWLLRQQLKYDNLIVSDALTRAAVQDGRSSAEVAPLALRAGCDVLLDPGDIVPTLDALERAYDDGTLDPERVRQSMRRRLKWAQWASPPNDWRRPSGADTAWGALLADRMLVVSQPLPALGKVTEIVVVDDDAEWRASPVSAMPMLDALRAAGRDARLAEAPTAASAGPLVIALFADHLGGKERIELLPTTVAQVRSLAERAMSMQRASIVIAFGAPRYTEGARFDASHVGAWSGDRVMQQAAARGIGRAK